MARVSYVNETTHPQLADQIAEIRSQRRGKLINIYGMLLHSPALADAWMGLINGVRWKTSLDARLREIVILRVAVLNKVDYVVNVHRAHFAAAGGVSADECDALMRPDPGAVFSDAERAVIALVDGMTRDVDAGQVVLDEVRRHFDEQATVELAVLIGAYNMHTRVVSTLGIDPE